MAASDKVNIDLSNYKDIIGARVTPGDYTVVVSDVELDKSRAGNQMINVWFTVLTGEFEGAEITDRLVLTDKSLFRVVGFMQAIGLPTPKKKLAISISSWVGKKLKINVDDGEPYNGKIKSEVRGYMRLTSDNAGESSTPDDLSGLDEFAGDESASEDDVDLSKVDLG